MFNRRERRKIERELGLTKAGGSPAAEMYNKSRTDEVMAQQIAYKEEQEARERELEVEIYAKQLRLYTEDLGYSLEDAEKILHQQRLRDEERSRRKRKIPK